MNERVKLVAAAVIGVGRMTSPEGLLVRSNDAGAKVATYSGGALGANGVVDVIAGAPTRASAAPRSSTS